MKREGDAKQRHHARRPHTHNNYNKSGRFSVCHLIARARRQTETNGMSRICDSLAASVLGCFLFLVALVWSAWSEGHYVTQLEVIQSARAAAIQYSCDSPDIVGTPPNELIFLEGCSLSNLPTWTDTQTDGFDYGDDASGAWFRSSTSMWQWTQTEHSETQGSGDSKRTYRWWTHRAVWKDRLLDSPTECDQPSYDAACRVPACRSGYEYPASTMSPPSAGACNPSVWPASPPPGTRYAPDGSVSVNAQNSVTLNSEQLRQLTSSRVVSPTNVPSTLGSCRAAARRASLAVKHAAHCERRRDDHGRLEHPADRRRDDDLHRGVRDARHVARRRECAGQNGAVARRRDGARTGQPHHRQ